MDLEQSSAEAEATPSVGSAVDDNPDYWYGLVDETVAADFINLSVRSLQGFRQKGGGPRFVRISQRCIKYRRHDLNTWAEDRLVSSTADEGLRPAPAAA